MFSGDLKQYECLFQRDLSETVDLGEFYLKHGEKCGTGGIFGDIHVAQYKGEIFAVKL